LKNSKFEINKIAVIVIFNAFKTKKPNIFVLIVITEVFRGSVKYNHCKERLDLNQFIILTEEVP